VVSNNQSDSCGLFAKPQVSLHEVNPRKCGKGVGELFTPANKDIHTYPQLIPTLGVLGWGELFNI
jgi:hypothetical protein